VCYSQCAAVSCSCAEYDLRLPYRDFDDCVVQRWTNLSFELAAGCLEEAVHSRRCNAEIEYFLAPYHPDRFDASRSSCKELSDAHARTCAF